MVYRCGWLTNKRVEVHRKNRPNATFTRIKRVASLLTYVAASTTVFFSEFVLNGKFNEGESAEVSFALYKAPPSSLREWRRYFIWTNTGYLSDVTFANVIDQLAE